MVAQLPLLVRGLGRVPFWSPPASAWAVLAPLLHSYFATPALPGACPWLPPGCNVPTLAPDELMMMMMMMISSALCENTAPVLCFRVLSSNQVLPTLQGFESKQMI